ncbi:hypothetical protein FS749_014375, partial [Ceratobasidium sp. UAMH 11750]
LDACVRLYKDTSLPTALPKLFGCIFTLILSLGYQSTVWKDQLTRDERAALYVAQAHFTRLHRHPELSLEWLFSPQTTITSGECGELNSVVPLEDISEIARLPQYRQKFADAVQSSPWVCELHYTAGKKFLNAIDTRLGESYVKFTSEYKRIVSEL